MTDATAYAQAVSIPGLEPERQGTLVEHILSRNRALPDRPPVPLAVSRCAAALLAADGKQRLSSPTALAQAETVAHMPNVGSTFIKLQESLMEMEGWEADDLARPGIPQDAVRLVLEHLTREALSLMKRLGY
jgi:hypothetical protein